MYSSMFVSGKAMPHPAPMALSPIPAEIHGAACERRSPPPTAVAAESVRGPQQQHTLHGCRSPYSLINSLLQVVHFASQLQALSCHAPILLLHAITQRLYISSQPQRRLGLDANRGKHLSQQPYNMYSVITLTQLPAMHEWGLTSRRRRCSCSTSCSAPVTASVTRCDSSAASSSISRRSSVDSTPSVITVRTQPALPQCVSCVLCSLATATTGTPPIPFLPASRCSAASASFCMTLFTLRKLSDVATVCGMAPRFRD